MRIVTAIDIRRPVEQVFDFLTTPGNWPRWHPSSLRVTGAVDHSLGPGEQVTEDFRVAGQSGTAVWTVRERQAPQRWVIDGVAENGNRATITYTVTAQAGGSRFERELVFVPTGPPAPELVLALLSLRIEAESAEALRRVKALLEEGLPAGG
jgi:uncharacterized protein YndB with AHSA1/START domain